MHRLTTKDIKTKIQYLTFYFVKLIQGSILNLPYVYNQTIIN
jgi:hypothetical protein